jgi:hypothetical protein
LVNNMPDGAFDATERQYLGLLEEGSGSRRLEVRRYTMSGVPRGSTDVGGGFAESTYRSATSISTRRTS